MAFALKMAIVDPIVDSSLHNTMLNGKQTGFQVKIRLSYYRGHFLSVIDELGLEVDGVKVPSQDITFSLNGKEFSLCELESCYHEFWNICDAATLTVCKPGGLEKGQHHIKLTLMLRSPYMPIGVKPDGNRIFMPVDSGGEKTLHITD